MSTTHTIMFYGLSTCVHCRHTKEFLEAEQIPFDLVYVDKLEGADRDKAIDQVRGYNPRVSFPTLVVDGGKSVIVGFQPDAIKEACKI